MAQGFAISISMAFKQAPLFERFALARNEGFSAVEIQWPYGEDADALAAAAKVHEIEVVLINLPADANPPGHGGGGPALASLPGREEEFDALARKALRYARALGCRQINILPGRRVEDFAREDQIAAFIGNLRRASALFQTDGVVALTEAVNPVDRPGALISEVEELAQWISIADHPNIKIQFDAYHVAAMKHDPVVEYERFAEQVAHVQIADYPGRCAPGGGTIDFPRFFEALDRAKYEGWIAAEYEPAPGENFDWLAAFENLRPAP